MASISELSDGFVDEYATHDPVGASLLWGVGRSGSTLTDYSPDGAAGIVDVLRRTRRLVDSASVDGEVERLGSGWMTDWLDHRLAMYESGERIGLVSPMFGPQAGIRISFDLMPRETDVQWSSIADRIEAVPAAAIGITEGWRAAIAAGRPASARLVAAVRDQCSAWAGGSFSGLVRDYGDGELRGRLDAAASAADRAYASLATFLSDEYLPAATDIDGFGEDRYVVWMADNVGSTDIDLDDAYAWGWDELARIEAEKAVECDRIIPGSGFDEVEVLLNGDPDRSVTGVEAYRSWLQELVDEAAAALNGTEFDIPDQLINCEVGIPPDGTGAAPFYTGPSEDGSTSGRVWFPTMGLDTFPRWKDVTTAYHEAVPGHHLQVGLTAVMPLTRFHRLGLNSAHAEGWALYAERLMDELGWFDTPDTRLGFLCAQALRAARVVIDIGLHTGRTIPSGWPNAGEPWTFDVAVAHLRRASGESTASCESEVLRYLSFPSQAITYKLGERAWLESREAARSRLGASFDRKHWHARALALGPMGLSRMRDELDRIEL